MKKEKPLLTEYELLLLEQCSRRYSLYKNLSRKPKEIDYNYELMELGLIALGDEFINEQKSISTTEAFYQAISKLENKYSEVEIAEIKLTKLGEFNDAISSLNLETSVPLQTKLTRKVDCSNKFDVKIKLSLLYRTVKAEIIRGVVISPYNNIQDISWSILHRLQYEILKDIHKKYSAADEVHRNPLLSILYYNKGWNVYSMKKSAVADQWKQKLSLMAELVDKDVSYPIIPCQLNCPFKQECIPA